MAMKLGEVKYMYASELEKAEDGEAKTMGPVLIFVYVEIKPKEL
jgi:hypothetical protein